MTPRLLAAAGLMSMACGPGPGAVKISISYAGPRDACLVVRTAPSSKPSKVEERRLEHLKHLATKTIGVIPAPGDGDALDVTVSVHERACDGPLVWTQQRSVTASRKVGVLELGILVRDADDDTWADAQGPFAGGQLAGTDCDDTRPEIHPTAPELCNGLDDDCNGIRDDGQQANLYFPDLDQDGWGRDEGDAGQRACVQPPGFALDAGDCDDFRAFVHPGGIETCDGFDDDCSGGVDEGYDVGMACTTGMACTGVIACTDAGTTFCTAPTPRDWYPDEDGDGHGLVDGGSVVACVQPTGRSSNADDCDDTNRFIHTGAREVCDGKDDDCDPTTAESCTDAGLKGFVKFPLPTNGVSWRAIAPFARGFTWVTGEGNQIVLRTYELPFGTPPPDAGPDAGNDLDAGAGYDAGYGDGGFLNYANRCTGNFRAAWATPMGRLYLGEGSNIDRLELDGGCAESWFTVQPNSEISGLSGVVNPDGGVTLFASVFDRRVVRVTDPQTTATTYQFDAGVRLWTVSALTRSLAVAAGDFANSQQAFFTQLEPDGGATSHVGAAGNNQYALASQVLSPTQAYFAGYNLQLWDGQTLLSGPGPITNHYIGLAAFGTNHVLLAEVNGRLWRYLGGALPDGGTGAEVFVDLAPLTSGASLRTLKATAPDDVWVVGDNNNILHFGD